MREISAASWFYYEKFITMHGHMSVKAYIYIYIYIQGVTGGTDQTSGECSLSQTIPI